MRKTDFEAIATAIRDARGAAAVLVSDQKESAQVQTALASMAKDIAAVCSKQNAKFDRERFLAGCFKRA